MDKYFGKDQYENDSPYLSGFTRKGNRPKEFRGKCGKDTYDPLEEIRRVYHANFTESMLNNIRKQYLTVKLRRLMAVELLKNRVGGNLKQVAEQINEQARLGKSREFVVLGGGPRSLTYCTRKKKVSSNPNETSKAFTIEVDVRGYIPDNVTIDTQEKRMTIRAVRVSGAEKVLGILAPSISALNKLKIHPPKEGILLLQYPGTVKNPEY